MSRNSKLPSNERLAQYLDQEVSLQQIEQLPELNLEPLPELNLEPLPDIDLIDLLGDLRGLDDE